MPTDCIFFHDTGYFSQLICDYLAEAETLKPLYNRFPNLKNFKDQIKEKQQSYSNSNRIPLVDALQEQYKTIETSEATSKNIQLLKSDTTFTVTTGHQLNLFTEPLYFLFKIVSAINLANQLKATYPDYNFVPMYWMATEDHDFEEINYFNFKGKKIQWNASVSGAVGELTTKGLEAVFNVFKDEIGPGKNAKQLKELFKNAYLKHDNLAQATHYLANQLFADYGLVILDANKKELKQLFVPFMEDELVNQTAFNTVEKTNQQIKKIDNTYKVQVNPRPINLFYIDNGIRERLVFENDVYKVLNTNITWTKTELQKHVSEAPERFSPNVIMRPLYQEVILPNLCYIGGGGELAYWFQLKTNFEANKVTFPMLLLRNSVLIKTKQQADKLKKLNISNKDIFLKRDAFINKKVREISNIDINFSNQIKHLKTQFKELYTLAEQTDKTFLGAVSAQEKKQIKGLEYLEARLLKAQKRKLKDHVERITTLQNQLFPNQSLQERNTNFSELYLEFGEELISHLIKNLEPLKGQFLILEL
ncbi:bacillithiol biosynthesis cysteine-adding enzyme BshC [Olleya sp. R77988]|uniref:bacillithiol biosynthesis cysteine-adding enzyme BshC n=1 Tax=Olleya sp. R77988 TaxID=3093875 RepID=UPI0037C51A9A